MPGELLPSPDISTRVELPAPVNQTSNDQKLTEHWAPPQGLPTFVDSPELAIMKGEKNDFIVARNRVDTTNARTELPDNYPGRAPDKELAKDTNEVRAISLRKNHLLFGGLKQFMQLVRGNGDVTEHMRRNTASIHRSDIWS